MPIKFNYFTKLMSCKDILEFFRITVVILLAILNHELERNMHLMSIVLLWLLPSVALAQINPDLPYRLKASVAKVHVITKNGGHGVGTGVVVGKDLVATNCHILANAKGVNISKYGDTFSPVALKADWVHDVCILRFQYLEMQAVELGDSESLSYEQEIFSIGFPGGPPKPQVNYGRVKALYPYDNATLVRTDASFVMGASGSPVFDHQGKLVAMSTFKSPGKGAFYYNIPVKWIKALLDAPETTALTSDITPFWDAPPASLPYFMQVVLPYQNQAWNDLKTIAQQWVKQEPNAAEAHYYLGVATMELGVAAESRQAFEQALTLQKQHYPSVIALGLLASKAGKQNEVDQIHVTLKAVDVQLAEEFDVALKAQRP